MTLLFRFRRWLARIILRGRLLDWWVLRRAHQHDRAYVVQLAREASAPAVRPPPLFHASSALRQILVISDCQWEHDQLVPELTRIAPTHVLDLRPILKQKPPRHTPAETVARAVDEFGSTASELSPDVVLFYARPSLLSEEVFDRLRRRWKCPLFGMAMDDKVQFFDYGILSAGDDHYSHWAGKFDLNLTNCRAATDWYERRGFPCLYVPNGYHPVPGLTAPVAADYRYRLSFLGSAHHDRVTLIEQIRRAGIKIEVFGHGWPDGCWLDHPHQVFRATQLNLGIGLASPALALTTLKGHDFECPGAGSCCLTTYNWELTLHYELGKEILCYCSLEELVEMYSWFVKRPEECLKIAQAAWRRCLAEHTWEQRFRKVFRKLGFQL